MSDYKLIDVTRLTKFKEKLLGILTYASPTASTSSTSIEFIDTVSQSNGKISASKKKVSTFEGGNTTGLVPAPGANASGTFLGSDGKWSKPTGTTYSDYAYSSTTKAGAAGLVPQPGTGDVGKFLKGGSGWSDLPTASTTGSGIVKLDNSTNSTSTTTAATSKAVNDVYTAAVNAASNAGATAGANAASSYATAAKNSADSASTYATNAKNSADGAASAANTAVTNKINALTGSTTNSTDTSTTFISSISQSKGVVTATKKTLPTANTTAAGIVKLTNTTGSTDTTTAATPNSVTNAINALTGSVTDSSATETSTTFISDINQTKGVVTATKKKLPTFAGSSQPGIVSASEGLSENYLLNATGGWTAIDEELDPDSTNPVQNKTLYNLETYHTLTGRDTSGSTIELALVIDNNINFKLKARTCINLYAESPIFTYSQDVAKHPKIFIDGKLYKIISKKYIYELRSEVHNNDKYLEKEQEIELTYLNQINFTNDYISGYGNWYFTTGNVFLKLFFTGERFIIVNNPMLIKYDRAFLNSSNEFITSSSIKYANGLKMQWLQNVFIKGSGGSNVILPLRMSDSKYTITEARKGIDLSDNTGYADKYTNYFFVDTENDHIADFFIIGY